MTTRFRFDFVATSLIGGVLAGGALVAGLVGCEATGGGASSSGAVRLTESGTKRGSAGGFSATLAAELGAPEGSLGAAAPGASASGTTTAGGSNAAPGGPPTGGSNAAPSGSGGSPAGAVAQGSAMPTGSAAGSAAGSVTSAAAAVAAAPAAGSAAPGSTGAAVAAAPAGSAAQGAGAAGAGAAGAGATGAGAAGAGAAGAGAAGAGAVGARAVGAVSAADVPVAAKPGKRAYVKPSAELAAIKFDLEPNWERDVGEAGTFSLVLKVPNSEDTRVFSVSYGYEDPTAPFDCDAYRKFLEDKKAMTVTLNRQRSGACYIEGTMKGAASFRYLVSYGGKLLTCQGSLYKDAASAALGDLRDKVLMQAKKICETLAL